MKALFVVGLIIVVACTVSYAESNTTTNENVLERSSLLNAVKKNSNDANSWLALGNSYYDSEEPDKAIYAYNSYLKLRPNDCNALADRGVCYRKLGAANKAVKDFEACLAINPDHVPSNFNLTVIYTSDLKNLNKAKETFNHLKEIAPDQPGYQELEVAIEKMETGS